MNTTLCKFQYLSFALFLIGGFKTLPPNPRSNSFLMSFSGETDKIIVWYIPPDGWNFLSALGHELHKNYAQKVSLGGSGMRSSRGSILFITAGRV